MRFLLVLVFVGLLFTTRTASAANFLQRRKLQAQDLEMDDEPLLKEKKPLTSGDKQVPDDVKREERAGGTTLLLIDVQNCLHSSGEAPIPGADDDAMRIADLIYKNPYKIDRIIATMDMRYKLHISHPGWWINDDGYHPTPNTKISFAHVQQGLYVPNPRLSLSVSDVVYEPKYLKKNKMMDDEKQVNLYEYALNYLEKLERSNRYNHTIWPEHCLAGTQGSNMHPLVMNSLLEWSMETGNSVEWLQKGHDPLTEMFSIMRADVVLSEETDYNYDILTSLLLSNRLLVAGQAKSHAVNWSLRDILEWWPEEDVSRIALLKDATSPVSGFEQEGQELETFLAEQGVKLINVADAF